MNMANSVDLGEMAGTVLVFGGPYSNLAATMALRERANQLGIPPERTICTGDLVAYCAEPVETVALIRDWGIAVVKGNCEDSLAQGTPDCGCGFDEGTTCSLLSDNWYRFADQRMSESDRNWMRTLPDSILFSMKGKSIRVIHGGVQQINRFVFPTTAKEIKKEELDLAGTDIVIAGHSGIPDGQAIGAGFWLNAGAIGLPANDGTLDGWYLLLCPEKEAVVCRWQRLSYPAARTAEVMRSRGLVNGYTDTLCTGLWPSMDVLPEAQRQLKGRPIMMNELTCC
ncbi:MAG: metallophosphatase family protein [Desulfuromonadales bacterium]|nr:metallophosphatase family protein [Desulfuromonadales bacterium]